VAFVYLKIRIFIVWKKGAATITITLWQGSRITISDLKFTSLNDTHITLMDDLNNHIGLLKNDGVLADMLGRIGWRM